MVSYRSTLFIVFALILNTVVFFQLWRTRSSYVGTTNDDPTPKIILTNEKERIDDKTRKPIDTREPEEEEEEDDDDRSVEEGELKRCIEILGKIFKEDNIKAKDKVCKDFYKMAKKAAGVYVDPSNNDNFNRMGEAEKKVWSKTVVLLSFNVEFMKFFFNWKCLLNDKAPIKYFIYAQSPVLSDKLPQEDLTGSHSKHKGYIYHNSEFSQVKDGDQQFMSKDYNVIVMNKVRVTMVLLSLGFNVLLSDADVMWADDPLPYIPTDADFAAQHGGCGRMQIGYDINNDLVNTGFIFVKSTNRSIQFYSDVMKLSLTHHRDLDDQTFFCMMLKRWLPTKTVEYWGLTEPIGKTPQKSDVLSFRTLEPSLFPAGCINKNEQRFKDMLQKWRQKDPEHNKRDNFVIYHPNYVMGSQNKVEKLKQNGMWDANCIAKEVAAHKP